MKLVTQREVLGHGEDIAHRHTTSRGGRVPLQSDNREAELVLSGGYSSLGLMERYACATTFVKSQ